VRPSPRNVRARRPLVKVQRQSAVLLVPMSIAWVLDAALTISFQPPGYWAGDPSQVAEEMVIVRFLLGAHPLLLIAGSSAYLALWYFATLAVPPRVGRYIATVFTGGHTWGASSWAWHFVPGAYWVILGLHVMTGVCLMACLECSIRCQQDAPAECR